MVHDGIGVYVAFVGDGTSTVSCFNFQGVCFPEQAYSGNCGSLYIYISFIGLLYLYWNEIKANPLVIH